MGKLFKKYDPVTKRWMLGGVEETDVIPIAENCSDCNIEQHPYTAASRLLEAYHTTRNHSQFVVRGARKQVAWSGTWNPNDWNPVAFTNYSGLHGTTHAAKQFQSVTFGPDPTKSGTPFIAPCEGWYNIKSRVQVEISAPAVPATFISSAFAELIYQDYETKSWFVLENETRVYSNTIVEFGPPNIINPDEQSYLRGWSCPVSDKVYLTGGTALWLVWGFDGAGALAFIEDFKAYMAVHRIAEPLIGETCCD
jgi:hypothetical protein